ncbi:hypothetical protein GCM10007885_10230 [Methylobacterium gnaphalii]|nr:hypothetical protein GCM10007885_10230 [Methylobacterium gnaphalii]
MRAGCLGRLLSRVALVDIGEPDIVTGGGLHSLGEMLNLGTVIGAGRRDMEGKQMPERIDGHVQL